MSSADAEINVGSGGGEPLAELVARLRAERDGLRTAMRSRAVIEQAKGVLMARFRLTADEAFARLLDASQRSNVKLAQVAATVVTTVSPSPAGVTGDATAAATAAAAIDTAATAAATDGADPAGPLAALVAGPDAAPTTAPDALAAVEPDATAVHTRYLLTVARLHAAESYEEIVEALAETRPTPSSVVLLLAEADGALRLVGASGLTAEVASQWARIPPQVDLPLTAAVRRGEPVLLPDPESTARAYPIIEAIAGRSQALVALPLLDGARVFGVLGMTWEESGLGGERGRAFLVALAQVCAGTALRIAVAPGLPGTEDAWLRPVLDATLGSSAVLNPVRSGGQVTDFVFEALNTHATGEAERYGLGTERDVLLSELPGPREVLLPLYRDVLADGRPRHLDALVVRSTRPGRPGVVLSLCAVRLGERVVASWRALSDGELLYDDMVATERLAGAASFSWWPRTGRWQFSPMLPELFDWPGGAPPTPATIRWAVDDSCWSAVRRAALATLRGGAPVTVAVTTRRGRWLRVTFAPTGDGGLRGSVRDLTELRAALSRRPHPS